MSAQERPRVGIGVLIWRDGKILLGKRLKDPGKGEYAWPGGHLEYMESIEECAKREVMEETGMEITNVRFVRLVNMKHYDPIHYVDIGVQADWVAREAELREPAKTERWDWYPPDSLPQPLFAAEPYYFDALKTGRAFYDS
jgi:8-oxo-dGTP diphosphatase